MTMPVVSMRRAVRLAIIGGAVVTLAVTARAETGHAAWPTWLRAGPGEQYVVIDEVSRTDTFEVLGCANGWCRAQFDRATGYIREDMVSQTGAALQGKAGPNTQPCFDARRAGYKDGETYSYCPK